MAYFVLKLGKITYFNSIGKEENLKELNNPKRLFAKGEEKTTCLKKSGDIVPGYRTTSKKRTI